MRRHILLYLAHAVGAEVEHARGEHGVGLALDDALGKMLERAHAAARDDGDRHGARNRTGERQVEPGLGAVAVHAREQDLARTAARGLLGPLNGIDARGVAPAGRVDLPFVGARLAGLAHALGVDGADHSLAAERRGRLRYERGILDRRRVERHLVGTRGDHLAHAGQVAETATHGVGDRDLLGRTCGHIDRGGALIARGRDVEEDHLVGALAVVGRGELHRVARIAQAHKVHALYHATVFYIHAGDDALGQHALSSPVAAAKASSNVKLPS